MSDIVTTPMTLCESLSCLIQTRWVSWEIKASIICSNDVSGVATGKVLDAPRFRTYSKHGKPNSSALFKFAFGRSSRDRSPTKFPSLLYGDHQYRFCIIFRPPSRLSNLSTIGTPLRFFSAKSLYPLSADWVAETVARGRALPSPRSAMDARMSTWPWRQSGWDRMCRIISVWDSSHKFFSLGCS